MLSQAQANVGEAVAKHQGADTAPQQVALAQAQYARAEADVQKAEADLSQADLYLSYCHIVAPASGTITRRSVEAGVYVQVGQPLMALVTERLWVVANFKETELTRMRPGQPVEIEIDSYPERKYRAHVDSIQRGTGARFSLLPPENASGNFVKVVQRVPVKIMFDETPARPISPGMSVYATVDVR